MPHHGDISDPLHDLDRIKQELADGAFSDGMWDAIRAHLATHVRQSPKWRSLDYEDVVSETMTNLLKQIPKLGEGKFTGAHCFRAYLITSADNTASKMRRSQRAEKRGDGKQPLSLHRSSTNLLADILEDGSATPSEIVMNEERISLIAGFVDALSPHLNKVTRLRYYEGLTVAEIANELEVPRRRIERQLSTARVRLAEPIRRHPAFSSLFRRKRP